MQPPDVSLTPDGSRTKHARRSASLDGLRGIAALSVFVFHGWLYTMPSPDASARATVGDYAAHELRLGLVLFFVLSGFLLSRPWFAAALGSRGRPSLRRYIRARAARIVPAYYAALVGSIVLLWGLAGTPGLRLPPAGELPLYFLFAQNLSPASVMKLNPPMWTLVVEVSFYALLPAIGWLALRCPPRRRVQALVPLALLTLGVLYNWAIAGRGLSMTFSKTLAAMLPYFALGMLAAVAVHGRELGPIARRTLIGVGAALVAADALVKAVASARGVDATSLFVVTRDVGAAAGFALVVAAIATAPHGRVVGSRVLAGLGTISYGFYLWHVPVLLALRGHGLLPLDPVLGSVVALAPALAVAALSWVALERPVMRWAARRAAEPELRGRRVDAGGREVSAARA